VLSGGAGGRGLRGGRTVGDARDEELTDAIDMEIEKARRTTYRTDFSEGSLCSWTPRECLQGTDRPWQRRPRSVPRTLDLIRVPYHTVPYHTVALRRDRTWLRILSDRESSSGRELSPCRRRTLCSRRVARAVVGVLVDIGAFRGWSNRTAYFLGFGFEAFPWPGF